MDEQLQSVRALPPDGRADEGEQSSLMEVARLANESVSPLTRLETLLHPWSAFVVLPVFALANAGVALSGQTVRESITHPVALGVIVGLVLGKPLGIISAALLAVRSGRGRLPTGVSWKQLAAGSTLGGVGFTVAIFVAGLAFTEQDLADVAKVGILLASVVASLIGAGALLLACAPGRSSGASLQARRKG